MSKQFLAVIAVIFAIFAGIVVFSSNKSDDSSGSNNSKAQPTQHIAGKGTSGVTVVEYGDFQCPYCEQYYPTVQTVKEQFGDQIKFQFRNYPLTGLHPNAFAAARAAEAAAVQGKFWEMHDALYESNNWSAWTEAKSPNSFFDQYAKQIGLKTDQFKTDFASSRVNDVINADLSAGKKLGITGTPSFFVDGKKVEIGNDVAAFTKTIQAAIDNKKSN